MSHLGVTAVVCLCGHLWQLDADRDMPTETLKFMGLYLLLLAVNTLYGALMGPGSSGSRTTRRTVNDVYLYGMMDEASSIGLSSEAGSPIGTPGGGATPLRVSFDAGGGGGGGAGWARQGASGFFSQYEPLTRANTAASLRASLAYGTEDAATVAETLGSPRAAAGPGGVTPAVEAGAAAGPKGSSKDNAGADATTAGTAQPSPSPSLSPLSAGPAKQQPALGSAAPVHHTRGHGPASHGPSLRVHSLHLLKLSVIRSFGFAYLMAHVFQVRRSTACHGVAWRLRQCPQGSTAAY